MRRCQECERDAKRLRRGLCDACYMRERRRDPSYAEDSRAMSRAWKERNRARVLRYNRGHGQHPCADCGAMVTRQAEVCEPCRLIRQRTRYPEIQRRWYAGESMVEIAVALDTTVGSLGVTIHRMRELGWDVPYRYRRRAAA